MWLEQSELGGEKEGGEGRERAGQVMQAFYESGENSGFYPEGGGSPGGLWAEEWQDPTQVGVMAHAWGHDRAETV